MDQSDIFARVDAIEQRNARVEAEKAWETSMVRVCSIAAMTYAIALVVLLSIGAALPYLSALIPAIGFVLSIQTLPWIRKVWIAKR